MGDFLVGRQPQLRSFVKALSESAQGDTRICVIAGEFGIGKTSLVRELSEAARENDHMVVNLRCAPSEGSMQLGLFRRLVFELHAKIEKKCARPVELENYVAKVLDIAPLGNADLDLSAATAVLNEIVIRATKKAALVITIDDCHLADASSLAAISCVMGWHRDLSLLLVICVTEGEPVQAPIELDGLTSQAARITLSRLTQADTAAITQSVFGRSGANLAAELHRVTTGNPLFLSLLLRHLVQRQGSPVDIAQMGAKVIGQCVYQHISRLSPPAARLAWAVAILGPESASLPVAADLAGLSLEEAESAANLLIRMRVLDDTDPLTFRLPVDGAAIVGQLTKVGLSIARLAAAKSLHNTNAPAELVARQLIETAAAVPVPWAADVLLSAARTARRRRRHTDAVLYLKRALRDAAACDRDRIDVELADTQLMVDLPAAIDQLAGSLMSSHDDGQRRLLSSRLGFALYLCDNHVGGRQVLTDLSRPLFVSQPDYVAWASLGLWYIDAFDQPDEKIRRRVGELLRVIPEGPSALRNGATALQAWLDYKAGLPSAQTADLALRVLDGSLPHDPANPLPLVVVMFILVFCGEFERAHEFSRLHLNEAQNEGRLLHAAIFQSLGGITANLLGDLRSAQLWLRESLADFDRHGVCPGHPLRVLATGALLDVLVSQGELVAARKLLTCNGLAGNLPVRWDYLSLLVQRARLKSASGDLPGALSDLQECASHAQALGGVRQELVPWRSQLALTFHRLGRRGEAEHLVEQDLAEARRDPAPLGLGRALAAAGVVAGGEQGIGLLCEAAKLLEECSAQELLARTLSELGCLLQEAGRYSDAHEVLERAMRLAKDRGAQPIVDLTRRRLADSCGKRHHAGGRHGLLSLTGQERRVMNSALRGQSNARIAEAMFVTRRTVELHLSSAYRKLGISGRGEFAKLFTDRELWTILAEQ